MFHRRNGLGKDIRREMCLCSTGGIPESVWYGHYSKHPKDRKKLKIRIKPRRLIHGVLVNHEYDFFETRAETLHDVVDALLVQESNFTTFGTSKDLHFLSKFRDEGWMANHQEKMAYIFLPSFDQKGNENGWYADAVIRRYLGQEGLKLITNMRDDDLFLLLDADELPMREPLLFLKLYDGYTEPIRFGFRWTVFGFFWLKLQDPSMLHQMPFLNMLAPKPGERLLQLWVLCTIGMLRDVYRNNAMLMRRSVWKDDLLKERVKKYQDGGHKIKEWDVGTLDHYAGHHCSWCYSPEGIRTKLMSA